LRPSRKAIIVAACHVRRKLAPAAMRGHAGTSRERCDMPESLMDFLADVHKEIRARCAEAVSKGAAAA